MPTFYFTYGTENHPFYGGWTEVVAPDEGTARDLFRIVHPNGDDGFLNCSMVYDEEFFQRTSMYRNGSYGFRCHERLTFAREVFTPAGGGKLEQEGVQAHEN